MQIDAHQHFWRYSPQEYDWIGDSMSMLRRNFLPDDLSPELKENRFDGSIAVQARQSLEETRWLLDLAERNPQILGVVGWVDLQAGDIQSQLKSLAGNPRLVGVRHIVQSEPDDRFLLQPGFLRGIAALEEFGLAYDILIYTKHLPVAVEFVQKLPRQRFVLDHLAKPPIKSGMIDTWAHGLRQLAAFPNVYCKLSGLVTEADWQQWTPEQIQPFLDVALDCFGSHRLMIGSDWPVCLVAASYARALGLVERWVAQRVPNSRADILGNNAARFYRLPGR